MTAREALGGDALALHPDDNVATALRPLETGHWLRPGPGLGPTAITLLEPIPLCHKFALRDIAEGEAVIKYGQVIGQATQRIPAGAGVHVHNLRSRRGSC